MGLATTLAAAAAAALLLASPATAVGCSNMTSLRKLTDAEKHAMPFFATGASAQIARTSPGIACGHPNLTPQQYGAAPPGTCDKPHHCNINSRGHASAHAFTNVTRPSADPDDIDNAASRLAEAAATALSYHHPKPLVTLEATSPAGVASFCIKPGMSGWTVFRPLYACFEGVLSGCDGKGIPAERNGNAVAVCAPVVNSGAGPGLVLEGTITFHSSTPKQAAAAKGNPALKTSAGPTGVRAGMGALVVAVGAAALVVLAV